MTGCRRRFLSQTVGLLGAFVSLPVSSCRRMIERAGPSPEASGFRGSSPGSALTPASEPGYLELERKGELGRREQELFAMLDSCRLCPRRCGANRRAGERGVCRAGGRPRVESAVPHFGEEAPLVGERGSGTIFFSHCNLRCCFCQNWEIAHRGDGTDLDHEQLAELMLGLQARGCHNINLVTPTHMLPHLIRALRIAIARGLRLPLVYNTGGYDSLEAIRLLAGVVDIYLPDFKFMDGKRSSRYCLGASDYPEVAAAVISEMQAQVGRLRTDQRGVATRGLILRHLVMPNNVAGTDRFVSWVARQLGPDTYVNLMDQYRPAHRAADYPEIARRLTREEWVQAEQWARSAGLTNLAA